MTDSGTAEQERHERLRAAVAEAARRRARRAEIRQEFQRRRQHGLVVRHAARLARQSRAP